MDYAGQAQFVVIPAEETAQRADEIELFGFTAKKHGLVASGPGGEAAVKMPGHDFGKAEIEAALRQVLEE